jgi:hypothetical protein
VCKALRRALAAAKQERQARAHVWAGKLSTAAAAPLTPPPQESSDDGAASAPPPLSPSSTASGQRKQPLQRQPRPPLPTKGRWLARAETLRAQLRHKMGHAGDPAGDGMKERPGVGDETGGGGGGGPDDDDEEASAPTLVVVSGAAGFLAFNKGGSGRLTWRELGGGAAALKLELGDALRWPAECSDDSVGWRKLLDFMDVDRDGRVTLPDFCAFLRLPPPETGSSSLAGSNTGGGGGGGGGGGDTDGAVGGSTDTSTVVRRLIWPVYLPTMLQSAGWSLLYPALSPLAVELAGSTRGAHWVHQYLVSRVSAPDPCLLVWDRRPHGVVFRP